MPLRGVYKPYRLKKLGALLRDALTRKGVWVHGFDAPGETETDQTVAA